MSKLTQDMTIDKPLGLIIRFAVPLMLGNLFQQAYTLVDSIIVGRGIGPHALAAIGAVDWLHWMFIGAITGLCGGFGIVFAKSFGQKDNEKLNKNISNSIILAIIIGVLLVVVAQLLALPLLKVLNTPIEIIDISLEYLRYLFFGLFVVMMFNLSASILRAVGNSKAPLVAMIISSIINIVLDLYFVYVLKMGIKGAAIATIIAQVFSAIYCVYVLSNIKEIKISSNDISFDFNVSKALLKVALPLSFMNFIIGIGGTIVQGVVNTFGLVFVTGITITNKLYYLFEIAGNSLGLSVATFVSQNHGARKNDRVIKAFKSSLLFSIGVSIVISFIMIVFGKNFIMLFVDKNVSNINEIIKVAYDYLFTMVMFLWVLYSLHIIRSSLQGLGNTVVPLYSSIIELIVRVSFIMVLPKIIGVNGVYITEVLAWIFSVVILSYGLYRMFMLIRNEVD